MDYIIGKTAGFCYGVKNAVDKATEEIKKEDCMYCLGEIVHNKNVVKDFENKGMIFIDNLEQNTENKKTIIRAHGVTKEIYEQAIKKEIQLVDLTCPKVLKIHKIVSEYRDKDYYIFLIGVKKHPEIIGTESFCGKNVYVIEKCEDIENAIKKFKNSQKEKLLIVAQTTFSISEFIKITELIESRVNKKIEIINTICNATKVRQEETNQISKKVDHMIVIGGKNSSNTKKLYEIAKKNCEDTICIESCNEINLDNLKGKRLVGIMAGASTPQSCIDELIKLVKNT